MEKQLRMRYAKPPRKRSTRTGTYDWDKNTRPVHPAMPEIIRIIEESLAKGKQGRAADEKAPMPSHPEEAPHS
jgi:hypothetical protein